MSRRDFVPVVREARRKLGVPWRLKGTYYELGIEADHKSGTIKESARALSGILGIPEETLRRQLGQLESLGFIEWARAKNEDAEGTIRIVHYGEVFRTRPLTESVAGSASRTETLYVQRISGGGWAEKIATRWQGTDREHAIVANLYAARRDREATDEELIAVSERILSRFNERGKDGQEYAVEPSRAVVLAELDRVRAEAGENRYREHLEEHRQRRAEEQSFAPDLPTFVDREREEQRER